MGQLKRRPPAALWSEPVAEPLSVADGGAFAVLDEARRSDLLARRMAGELPSLTFRAITFRPVYPNANFLRFRDEELPEFCASFAGQPFLRDHDQRHIEARGGTIAASELSEGGFLQTVTLTVPRDIEAFLLGQIDRFSISWYWQRITCSVCGSEWLSGRCTHWPGRRSGDGDKDAVCELIFECPRGKEVSAVNVPAVAGTGVRELLAHAAGRAWRGRARSSRATGTMEDTAMGEDESVAQGVAPGAAIPPEPQGDAAAELLQAQRSAVLDGRLAASGLPAELQELVRGSLPAAWRVPELDAALERARASWARLEESRTVQRMHPAAGQSGRIEGMLDSRDRLQLALDGLLASRRPERGVRPLSGIREFYILISGDYEMRGVFQPENVGLASVDSSTMAGMVANAMNKVIVSQFARYDRWWEPLCMIEDFQTLQQVRWITLGGVGDLPTVAEGAAYTELTWEDQTETSDWVKKGGYLGISLEAIDKDDTRRLQQAAPALARSAWLSLAKAVSNIFTTAAGAGPTMSDLKALFHIDHGNLGTTALSYAAWEATRTAMRKQTELNSGDRLGGLVVPRYLLVPPELEGAAVQLLGSEGEPGQANRDDNPWAEGNGFDARMAAARRRVIVVDLWTDSNNWAAAADPQLYPSIGLGFRFGREPELFSVASPTSGLMFTNDTLPVKVRYFFAVGPTDWRGLYKHNVA